MATVARDITERQRSENALRESERRFRHLVEQAAEAIFVYDLSGRLIDVNEESCRMLGYPRSELLILSAGDIDPEFDVEKQHDRWKNMVPGVAVTLDGTLRRRDGSVLPIEARMAAFRSEGQKLVLALVRDITERRQAEEELRQAHDQLEGRVRERTAELAKANEGLQQALRENSLLATAIESSQIGVLISDPGQPDIPTIFANAAFTRITGYERHDVVGRNCRILQGTGHGPEGGRGHSSGRRGAPAVQGHAAQLPQGRHAVLERVDRQSRVRRGGQAHQFRRSPVRRDGAGRGPRRAPGAANCASRA